MNLQKGNSSAIVGILAAVLIIGAGVWYYMKQGTMAAPVAPAPAVVDNTTLSASDDPASIQKDADDAYMTQLQADIDADLKAIESI